MKKNKYAQSVVFLLNTVLIVLGLVMVYILYTFAARIIKHDYTTTNLRKIEISLPPKEWDFKTKNYLMITGSNPDAYLRYVHGEFETHNSPISLFVFVHLYDLWLFAGFFAVAYLLRKFIKAISKDNIFTISNIKTLKLLSFIIILVPIVDQIMQNFILFPLIKDLIFESGTRVAMPQNIYTSIAIVVGCIILAITKIIETGIKLKEENDLTV